LDEASRKKTKKLIESGETVFIWPEEYKKSYKDINEMCEAKNIGEIDPDFFIDNSFCEMKARLLMTSISR